jgi:nitronate monooxygenase
MVKLCHQSTFFTIKGIRNQKWNCSKEEGKDMWKNKLTEIIKITYPIIQAPMAGGPTTTRLVSAVSNAGGLGMIGAGYMDAESLRNQIREVKKVTDKPFGVNLFVPNPYTLNDEKVNKTNDILKQVREELAADSPTSLPNYKDDLVTFDDLVDIIIEENVSICSFTFGLPSEEIMTKLKDNKIIVIGTATTVQEAIFNEQAGMDAVVVQGTEAGGHRGTFVGEPQQSLIGLMSLIPQTVDHVNIPVIAAGGIMDGRGIMASKCLGAQGCQLGTAFLVCEESGANSAHKDAIVETSEEQIVLTKSFSGKAARGIHNEFIEKMKDEEDSLPDYPLQNELTKGIRKAASISRNPQFMSLWAGQSPRLATKQTVQELMKKLVEETEKIIL